ncbi:F-box protein At5g50450-like [Magnolia sinica]|uniref:F-box protein At5g50450-like n=1 Tax=Magnolia sinica TaxID=86752 RepID=UPI0026595C8F|nr:F-box protein At5g50450-like [Magnolia sinica]
MKNKKMRDKQVEEEIGSIRSTSATDFFNRAPDDLIVYILTKLSSTAGSPSDFISLLITCKRLNSLGQHPLVLSRASPESLAVKASNWSDSAHRFFKLCADAGNVEACFCLGMIRFYCMQSHSSGVSLIAKAAIHAHAPALYSLAVIQFNGSSCSKNDKDLGTGIALCARAASLGHVDAFRELGHCLQDGYGVRQNITEGHRLLMQANSVRSNSSSSSHLMGHPVNQFMVEWFRSRGQAEQRMCRHIGCGRPEMRQNEFRRCSGCGIAKYCSRACQAVDWKLQHKVQCALLEQWLHDGDVEDENDDDEIVVRS